MHRAGVLYWLISVIVAILIAWVAFSLIVTWATPEFYDANGDVNWWTTMWVIVVSILLAILTVVVLHFLFQAMMSCAVIDECDSDKSEVHLHHHLGKKEHHKLDKYAKEHHHKHSSEHHKHEDELF